MLIWLLCSYLIATVIVKFVQIASIKKPETYGASPKTTKYCYLKLHEYSSSEGIPWKEMTVLTDAFDIQLLYSQCYLVNYCQELIPTLFNSLYRVYSM